MSEPTVVYLVEDHTDPEPTTYTKYFAHVYRSRDKAADGTRQSELYKVVPLRVHPDDQPEP